jgi:uncharacterized protein YjbJ (UPF0337 family)
MNKDIFEGKWKQLKGNIREKWGNLTDDDVEKIAGKYENLLGRIQERYGINTEKAQKMIDDWEA